MIMEMEDKSEKKVRFSEDTTEIKSIDDKLGKKVRFSEDTTEIESTDDKLENKLKNDEDFMVELINNYTTYFKKIYGKSQEYTLFDGIDMSDDTSTNKALEEFFEELCKFRVDDMINSETTKIVKYDEKDTLKKSDELYAILENGIPLCVSVSLFAILIELTNLKILNNINSYEIISLK